MCVAQSADDESRKDLLVAFTCDLEWSRRVSCWLHAYALRRRRASPEWCLIHVAVCERYKTVQKMR